MDCLQVFIYKDDTHTVFGKPKLLSWIYFGINRSSLDPIVYCFSHISMGLETVSDAFAASAIPNHNVSISGKGRLWSFVLFYWLPQEKPVNKRPL